MKTKISIGIILLIITAEVSWYFLQISETPKQKQEEVRKEENNQQISPSLFTEADCQVERFLFDKRKCYENLWQQEKTEVSFEFLCKADEQNPEIASVEFNGETPRETLVWCVPVDPVGGAGADHPIYVVDTQQNKILWKEYSPTEKMERREVVDIENDGIEEVVWSGFGCISFVGCIESLNIYSSTHAEKFYVSVESPFDGQKKIKYSSNSEEAGFQSIKAYLQERTNELIND